MNEDHFPRSCASCGQMDCSLSYARNHKCGSSGITTFILDDVWPEYDDYLTLKKREGDQVLAPGFAGRTAIQRYNWSVKPTHKGSWQTALRHMKMHQVKSKSGAIRQRTYLALDKSIAEKLAKFIDYHATHLVIQQNFLPWLARAGVLGGRSYDVLMTRYPLKSLHEKLDRCASEAPNSKTISDFRAEDSVVDAEWQALNDAKRLITPHYGIAAEFPEHVLRLEWQIPKSRNIRPGNRIAFLGPVAARQGAYVVKEIARTLAEPLIVLGQDLEGPEFWSGIRIERRQFQPGWLNGVGTILHPAIATNQPRHLLYAVANGVRVYANPEAGLAPHHYRSFDEFSA